jgi:hypothetical protein
VKEEMSVVMNESPIWLVFLETQLPLAQNGIAVSNPTIYEEQGRRQLRGITPPVNDEDWMGGLKVVVELARISHYFIFDSLADYQARMAVAGEAPLDRRSLH